MPPISLTVALLLLTQTVPAQPPSSPEPEQPAAAAPESADERGAGAALSTPPESPPVFSQQTYAPQGALPRRQIGEATGERPASLGQPTPAESQTPQMDGLRLNDSPARTREVPGRDRYAPQVAPATRFEIQGEAAVDQTSATGQDPRGASGGARPASSAPPASSGQATSSAPPASSGQETSSGQATSSGPSAPVAPAAPTALAWLQGAWQRLPGPSDREQAVTLYDAVRRGTFSGRRQEAVVAYWKLCEQQLRVAVEQQLLQRLMELQPPEGSGAMLLWRAAYDDTQAELQDAELERTRAQLDLQGFWPRGMDVRPRASEMPFAGAYQTRLESLYPAASAPAVLERLHAILPLELAAVEARARAAVAQERVTEALAQAYLQGQVDLTSVTGALERLRRQRSQVVEGIIGYNRHIAEYALSVGAGQGDATVASMLIPRPEVPATEIMTRGELQPVAAVETLQAVPGQTPANQAVIFRDPAPYSTPLPSGSR